MVSVTTRYSGFIEKVFVNHVGQPVRRGDPLFEVYSPELVQTQRELISAVSYAKRFDQPPPMSAHAPTGSSRPRGPGSSTGRSRPTGRRDRGHREIHRTLTVFAPSDGVVMQRMHGLDGMAIRPGMELLHIVDLSSLWLRAEVYENQLPWLDIGSKAEVTLRLHARRGVLGTGPLYRTRGLARDPNRHPHPRGAQPSGRLRVGMFATVNFAPVETADALTIPSQAVIRSGTRNIAVVDLGEGRFAPREVVLGAEADGFVEIVDGLSDGDRDRGFGPVPHRLRVQSPRRHRFAARHPRRAPALRMRP